MSITAITIENFKGIKDPVRIELKPITLLFGPNSAGKSTVIQALHYAREIFVRGNVNPSHSLVGGDAVSLSGFKNVVHNHDINLPILISFELTSVHLPDYVEGFNHPYAADQWFQEYGFEDALDNNVLDLVPTRIRKIEVTIVIEWCHKNNEAQITEYKVTVNDEPLLKIKPSEQKYSQELYIDPSHSIFAGCDKSTRSAVFEDLHYDLDYEGEIPHPLFSYLNDSFFGEYEIPGMTTPIILQQSSPLPKWGVGFNFSQKIFSPDCEEVETSYSGFFTFALSSLAIGPGELVRNALKDFRYIGPLRNIPPRSYEPELFVDESRWANGLAAWDILYGANEKLLEHINGWLFNKDRLDTGYKIVLKQYVELDLNSSVMKSLKNETLAGGYINARKGIAKLPIKRRLLLKDIDKDLETMPQDVGVGISQILPVVVAALYSSNGFFAIEQPELHIHPALQVALGDLFIEQIRKHDGLFFILETHSEHLLLRLLRRIRETNDGEVGENQKLSPSELGIHFIESTKSGMHCKIIRVDEEGDFIDQWPQGFFAERAEELF